MVTIQVVLWRWILGINVSTN